MNPLPPPPDWMADAVCAQTDPDAFFPEKGGSTREAKRVCSGCEVRAECLAYALANDERFGIYGGLSERERRRVAAGKSLPVQKPPAEKHGGRPRPPCGTRGGYDAHRYRDETACHPCRVAMSAYERERRAKRGAA